MGFGQYNNSKDMLDDYMGYKLSSEGGSSSRPARRGSSGFKGIIIAVIVIIGIVMLYDALRPKCAHEGCDNTPEEGSSFCLIHNPKYYSSKSSYTPAYTTATTTRPTTTTAGKVATQKTTKKTTTRKADEYGAQEYDDPEDFYEDHYDDFWDYEDAEDYWEENY